MSIAVMSAMASHFPIVNGFDGVLCTVGCVMAF